MNPFVNVPGRRTRLARLVLLFVLLSGCGGSPQAEMSPAPTDAPSPAATRTRVPPTPVPAPTDTSVPPTDTAVPTETSTPFVPRATVRIAVHVPLSGGLAPYGQEVLNASELAVSQLAGPLQEQGIAVDIAAYDDQNDISVASGNARELSADPEVLCGVGNLTSRVLIQMGEIYHQAGLPFISPSATASFITGRGYVEVSRLIGRNDEEGLAGARFAFEEGFQSVFVIAQVQDMPQFVAAHFQEEAEKLGMDIVGRVSIETEDDFEWLVGQVLAANADLVYFSTFSVNQAGTFFRDARAAGYTGAFLGMSGMENRSLVELGGPLLIDGGGMYFTNTAAPARYYQDAGSFVRDYSAAYGAAPGIFAAESYDAAGICLHAIESALQAAGGELPTRAAVAAAIRSLDGYPGITGLVHFTEDGEPEPARYYVFRVASEDPDDWEMNELVRIFELTP